MNLTRRDALKSGAGAVALSLLHGCVLLKADRINNGGFIDAHSHVWSDDLKAYPLGPWATRDSMQPATFSAEELLVIARPQGVERVVLIQHAPLHGYDNSYILDCARMHPGTFSVVAMINERESHLKERLRDLRDQGARGIRIGPTKHADRTLNVDPPNWLKASGQQALWQYAAELGVALCPLVGAEFLPTLQPMCAQYPDTTVVIDHFGHIDPANAEQVKWLTDLAQHRNVHVKLSGFYKFGDKKPPYDDIKPMIRLVIDAFGPDRLMWGSDCPFQLNDGNTYSDAVALMRDDEALLSSDERRKILHDTARRVFY